MKPSDTASQSTAERTPESQSGEAVIEKRRGNYLPHWTSDGATYAVTFRLADALPSSVLESWLWERRDIIRTAEQINRPLSAHEQNRLRELHSERIETWLDSGHGICAMRNPDVADIVENALQHFDGDRYQLHAWCVMPNHVHVLVEPMAGQKLPALLHSWKSFTAKAANRILKRSGAFWQDEYYDHLIRDEADYAHALRYILENPGKAGLKSWRWCSSRGSGILPAESATSPAGGTPEPRRYRPCCR